MAFIARLTQLRYNSVNKEGGGPHTLICKDCNKAFAEGDLINGPTRNRANVPVWKDSTSPSYYHKLLYWHEDCRNPQPTTQTVLPPRTDGWQRVPPQTPTTINEAPSSPISAPVQTPPSTPAPNGHVTTDDNRELIANIVSAFQNQLIPQLEKSANELERKLDDHIAHQDVHGIINVKHNLNNVESELRTLTTRVSNLETNQPTQLNFYHNDSVQSVVLDGITHHAFPRIVRAMQALHPERRNIWLTGPAGSGKTTAAKQLSVALTKLLDRTINYYFNGSIDTEYKLSGFIDANGNIVSTAFRTAWTTGGVYLFDECDGSMPGALLAFNGALANGAAPFPGSPLPIPRHPDCYILAAANTWGWGGDANYVGRAKLDGAFLDRFPIKIFWGYDNILERAITGNDKWVDVVQAVRSAADTAQAKVLITPRSSQAGAELLAAGYTKAEVVEEIFGYLARSLDNWDHVGRAAIAYANN